MLGSDPPFETTEAPPAKEPKGISSWFDPSRAPVLPIPEIDVDPQSGLTIGIIPTLLHTNDRDEIVRIDAPDLIHSQYFGWGGHFRVFGYPSENNQWSVVGGLKERVEREFDARYTDDQARTGPYSWWIETLYDRSGTPRFFGIGNTSFKSDETTYIDNQGRIEANFGYNFSHEVQLSYNARWRIVTVLPGMIPGVPSIEKIFPRVPGLGAEHEIEHRLTLTWDTRDSTTIPREGGRYNLYVGAASRIGRTSTNYYDCGGFEGRNYWPVRDNMTLAWHGTLRYMSSARRTPFWALSSLGGESSVLDEREPLRGFGEDRFIGRNMFASGFELRTRVLDLNAFSTHLQLEVAPFLEAGKVFPTAGESPVSHLHHSGGIGFRGIAPPYVVGYVDVGYGSEGAAVFTGIGYPF